MAWRDFIPTRRDWLTILRVSVCVSIGMILMEWAFHLGSTSDIGGMLMAPIIGLAMIVISIGAM